MRMWEDSGSARSDVRNGRSVVSRIAPGDDLEASVLVFGERRAALHPVAAVHVADALLVTNDGVVNVTADHSFGAVTPCFGDERGLERANIVHRVLDLQLGPLRQRPIGHA